MIQFLFLFPMSTGCNSIEAMRNVRRFTGKWATHITTKTETVQKKLNCKYNLAMFRSNSPKSDSH